MLSLEVINSEKKVQNFAKMPEVKVEIKYDRIFNIKAVYFYTYSI